MPIPFGNSAMNDSAIGADELAADFNSNLHEHFQALRGQKMAPVKSSTVHGPNTEGHSDLPHEGNLRKHESARRFEAKRDQLSGHEYGEKKNTGKLATIIHNRKTGGVISSTSQGAEYSNGQPLFAKHPSDMNHHLTESSWRKRDQDDRFKDSSTEGPHYDYPQHLTGVGNNKRKAIKIPEGFDKPQSVR